MKPAVRYIAILGILALTAPAFAAELPKAPTGPKPASVPATTPAKPAAPKTIAPRPKPSPDTVYIVTRSTTTESRALLSARLVKLNAKNLHWYENAGVVRADLPKESLTPLRADPEVILALPQSEAPANAGQKCALPAAIPSPVPAAPDPSAPPPQPTQPAAQGMAPMPMQPIPAMQPGIPMAPNMGVGMGGGIGMGPMGFVDSLAGGVVTKMLNRPPSCKIAIAKASVTTSSAGGDEVIEIKGSGSCAWQAQSSVPWIHITSGYGVSGYGVLSYTVLPGEGKKRTGSVAIIASQGGMPIKGSATVVVIQTLR